MIHTNQTSMKASICIPTLNAEKYIEQLLRSILDQHEQNFEIIIFDSSSTDKTVEIINSFKDKRLKLFCIDKKDFGHGKTRNLMVEKSSGEFIIFLSQDALPIGNSWLHNLINTNIEKDVVACFGRQIAYPDSKIFEHFFNRYHYLHKSYVVKPNQKPSIKEFFFSNASSCFLRKALVEMPFRTDIPTTEDQAWIYKALKNGFKIAYAGNSIVLHSHNHNYKELWLRYFDSSVSLSKILGVRFFIYSTRASGFLFKELRFIYRNHNSLVIECIFRNIVKISAVLFGIIFVIQSNHQKQSKSSARKKPVVNNI